jgi:hypothetical protein
MTKTKHWLSLSAIALANFGFSSVAQAKSEFPNEMRSDPAFQAPDGGVGLTADGGVGLTYDVPCSVCHIKDNTGSSTPITPFARSLRARGLSGSNGSLHTSLQQLKEDGVDSDGDGVTDIAELIAGTDPNSSANASLINDREPGYGCGGSPPTGRDAGPAFASALALAWLFLHRRRGRP